ncbi:hypothetical protein [Rubrivivax gelatinosus]|uniref:Uncharacterized protein n=1 Tax=Rubrivivax gelatinosus TaxID=28068 RepID=A0A4R2M093_RUBGE|nr:hypothetical protein [Rubrivivax gelatinosus]MBK1689465.1 hypothetical protein [Rubrivivax gelatinosus]TCO97416.1 hypothetical protein EV684_12244 [Rubrivivax gelatinosus]
MAGFIDYAATARETERALMQAARVLGLDWQDAAAVQALVGETLDRRQGLRPATGRVPHGRERLRLKLCALVVLRRRLELELDGAGAPGAAWRVLSRVLDREIDSRLGGG